MEEAATDLLADLNPAQRTAALTVRGPLCILAGAGTGKTRTVTHRIAHQVASGVVRAEQILAVTFTERAAGELRARLSALGIGVPVRAATFHAAAWAQLRWFWPRVRQCPLPEVLSSKIGLLARAARRVGCEARDLASEIEWAKARRLSPQDYTGAARERQTPADPEAIAHIYERYEADKAAAGALDYEDMLLWMTDLLERPEVAQEVRDRYRAFTVDEFQDVNPAQWALLRAWLGESDDLCVVGDDDQTIFSFTGASAGYLVGFRRSFPHAQVVTLTQNYRSTPQILDLANRVLWTKPARARKRLTARAEADGPEPVFREFADADAEVDGVVGRVQALLDQGTPAGEIAICYRINAQSEPFEEALRAAGVPYTVRGDGGFFQRPEVRQALRALSEAAARPTRVDPSLARPRRADRDVEQVLRERLSWHPRREPAGQAARERWRNLGELLAIATAIADEADASGSPIALPELVAGLAQRAQATQESRTAQAALTLLSLHRAKGSEFDAMLLVALEEGLLPISHARSDAEIEEERRLLYVGVTRARRHLWLSWARRRPGWSGREVSRRPSRFLYHLGEGAPVSGRRQAARAPAGPETPAQARAATQARAAKEARAANEGSAAGAAGPADAGLAERLKQWRLQRAQSDGVPAYVVFPNATLEALASAPPGTLDELRSVSGFGPKRVAQYGEDVLRVLKDFACGGQG